MGSVGKAVSNIGSSIGGAFKNPGRAVTNLWNNPIVNPIQSLGSKVLSGISGRNITPWNQMQMGAQGGAAITALRGLGVFGAPGVPGAAGAETAGATGVPTAGIGGVTSNPYASSSIAGLRGIGSQVGQASKLGTLAGFAGLGMLGAGIFGPKGPSIDEAINAGQGEEAQRIINELAAEQEAKRTAFLEDTKKTLATRRAENVAKLQGRLSEQSKLELPKTLEDLQGRGLLNSETAVAQALADQQARNTLQVQGFEQSQSAADAAIEDQIAMDIINGRMGLEKEALSTRFGYQDAAQNARIAAILAERQAKANQNQGLIQAGGQFIGYGLLPRLLGVG